MGFGAGVALVVIAALGVMAWYQSRPDDLPPWNRDALTARYSDLFVTAAQPVVFTFRYMIENHSGKDYQLPSADSLFRTLANGKGLDHGQALAWDGGTSVPTGQVVNIGIKVEFPYPEDAVHLDEKLSEFTASRLAEMDGFVALDQVNRYEIRFPKPPEDKK